MRTFFFFLVLICHGPTFCSKQCRLYSYEGDTNTVRNSIRPIIGRLLYIYASTSTHTQERFVSDFRLSTAAAVRLRKGVVMDSSQEREERLSRRRAVSRARSAPVFNVCGSISNTESLLKKVSTAKMRDTDSIPIKEYAVIMLHIGQVKSQHLQSDLLLQPTLRHIHACFGFSAATHHTSALAHRKISFYVSKAVFLSLPQILCCFAVVNPHFTQNTFIHTCLHATCTPSLTCTHSFTLPRLSTTFSLTSPWYGLGTSVLLLMPTGENKINAAFVLRAPFIFVIVLYTTLFICHM